MNNSIRGITYSIFAGIALIVAIRIFFVLIGANPSTPFVKFWYDLSFLIIAPWYNIFPNIVLGDSIVLEIYSMTAVLFIAIFAILTERTFSIFTKDSRTSIIIAVIDLVFKVAEFVLISRFLLRLFSASGASFFVQFIYQLSSVIYRPFAGIIQDLNISGIIIELSTLLIIVIVVILDIAAESVLRGILGGENHENSSSHKGR